MPPIIVSDRTPRMTSSQSSSDGRSPEPVEPLSSSGRGYPFSRIARTIWVKPAATSAHTIHWWPRLGEYGEGKHGAQHLPDCVVDGCHWEVARGRGREGAYGGRLQPRLVGTDQEHRPGAGVEGRYQSGEGSASVWKGIRDRADTGMMPADHDRGEIPGCGQHVIEQGDSADLQQHLVRSHPV